MTQADLVVFPGSVTHLLSDLGQVIWTASAFPASVRLNGVTPGTCLELCLEAPNSCLLLWPTLPSLTPSLGGVSFPFLSGQPPSTHWIIIFQLVIFPCLPYQIHEFPPIAFLWSQVTILWVRIYLPGSFHNWLLLFFLTPGSSFFI